jgi:hypothetical protein
MHVSRKAPVQQRCVTFEQREWISEIAILSTIALTSPMTVLG